MSKISPVKKLQSELEKCKGAHLNVKFGENKRLADYAGMNDKAAAELHFKMKPKEHILVAKRQSKKDQAETLRHERIEREKMAKGTHYFPAHEYALAHQNPLLGPVYHGTPAYLKDATQLHKGRDYGIHFGTEAQAWGRLYHRGGDVIPAMVEISNMKRERDTGYGWREKIRQAKAQGYDGIVYLNRYEGLFAHDKDQFIDRLGSHGYPPEKLKRMRQSMYRPSLFNAMTDEEFKEIFPEAADSYIVFSRAQVKPYTGWEPIDQLPIGVRA